MTTNNQKSGIYRIKNLETGAMYIGQTSMTFASRWGRHRRALKAGQHINAHLQNSYNKHGKGAFEYKILEVILQGDMSEKEFSDYINEREIILIAEHDAFENGYNFTEGGGGRLGYEMSAEHRAKMSAAMMGNKNGSGHTWNKGRTATVETKAKMSVARKGRKFTDEHRANISKANKGRKVDEAGRANISKAHKGKPWSPARREAQEAHKERL